MVAKTTPKVLLIENSGADFYRSRLKLALYLQDSGYEVSALVPDDGYVNLIEYRGLKVFHYPMERSDKGVFQILRLIRIYRNLIKNERFDLIHSFRFQPNFIISVASLFLPPKIVLHITGLGIAYANNSLKYKILRSISQILYFYKFLVSDLIIVQNPDDIKSLWFTKLNSKKTKVVLGSGIDLELFSQDNEARGLIRKLYGLSSGDMLFICITRLLWEKGIKEMTSAFSDIQIENPKIKLFIVGWSDEDNPRHIPQDFIDGFKDSKSIVFTGEQKNINNLLSAADVFIYPSYYREGIPRAILEALAMSLPIITTKTPGCRLTVKENKNGVLIEPRSKEAIKHAVIDIVSRKVEYKTMGNESRILAEQLFSDVIIFKEIAQAYRETLD